MFDMPVDDLNFYVSTGAQAATSELIWSTGEDDGSLPNVRSELTYSDIISAGLFTTFGVRVANTERWSLGFEISLAHDVVQSGDVQDSDYSLDDRQGEFNRSYMDLASDSNNSWAVDMFARYKFTPKFAMTGNILIDSREMNMIMVDGELAIGNPADYTGLRSKYESEYDSVGAGIGMDYLSGHGRYVFHATYLYSDFEAVADWNLRGSFEHPVSFEDGSDGDGFIVEFQFIGDITDHLFWTLGVEYVELSYQDGKRKINNSNGTTEFITLQDVDLESAELSAGITFLY